MLGAFSAVCAGNYSKAKRHALHVTAVFIANQITTGEPNAYFSEAAICDSCKFRVRARPHFANTNATCFDFSSAFGRRHEEKNHFVS